jgi:hypothetical protein
LLSVIGEKQMTKPKFHPLSPEELYALEHEARRLRAEALSGLFRDAARALRGAFSRTATAPAPRTMRHA